MIRAYRDADCDDVLNVWSKASAIAHPFLSREFLSEERRKIPDVYLPNAETWVWEAEGRVLGFLALIGNEIGALFVDPDYHRSGIGRALLGKAQSEQQVLEVEVFEKNRIGRAFYSRVGFEHVTSRVHDETGFELLRLRLAGVADREHRSD